LIKILYQLDKQWILARLVNFPIKNTVISILFYLSNHFSRNTHQAIKFLLGVSMKTMITLVLLFLSMNSFAGITRNKCDISIDGYAGPRAHSVFEGKEKSAQIGEVVAQQLINKGFNVVHSNTTESTLATTE
jgi:hypothetical protein